jgi:hypothetical protein
VHGHALAIRVQSARADALQLAEDIRKAAEKEGAAVDLVAVGETVVPRAGSIPAPAGHPRLVQRSNTLRIGLSVGYPDGWAGTLGCFVLRGNLPGLLSCCHVLATPEHYKSETQRAILVHHPGPPENEVFGPRTRIARLEGDFIEFTPRRANQIDAAVAMLLDRNKPPFVNRLPDGLDSPFDNQALGSVLTVDQMELGVEVGKVGRTTGFTKGRIQSLRLDQVLVRMEGMREPIRYVDVIDVEWEHKDRPFTLPGDSGAVVFTLEGLHPIGLHFAAPAAPGRSWACPISKILAEFDASLL